MFIVGMGYEYTGHLLDRRGGGWEPVMLNDDDVSALHRINGHNNLWLITMKSGVRYVVETPQKVRALPIPLAKTEEVREALVEVVEVVEVKKLPRG